MVQESVIKYNTLFVFEGERLAESTKSIRGDPSTTALLQLSESIFKNRHDNNRTFTLLVHVLALHYVEMCSNSILLLLFEFFNNHYLLLVFNF